MVNNDNLRNLFWTIFWGLLGLLFIFTISISTWVKLTESTDAKVVKPPVARSYNFPPVLNYEKKRITDGLWMYTIEGESYIVYSGGGIVHHRPATNILEK
jgi:hypothetical protein